MNYRLLLVMVGVGMLEGRKLIIKAKRNKYLAHTKDDKHGKIGRNGSDYNLKGAETESCNCLVGKTIYGLFNKPSLRSAPPPLVIWLSEDILNILFI